MMKIVPLQIRPLEVAITRTCPCCGMAVDRYLPLPPSYVEECRRRGVEHPLHGWETLSLDEYLCPQCGATDRDRLQVAFLAQYLSESAGRPRHVLELAPSRPVSRWLQGRTDVRYRSADLAMANADDRVDVMDMAIYPDGTFDIVICSHVLEHVPDDLRAMREIRRVMAVDGVAILLVPISRLTEGVIEDVACADEAERWRRFGQGDHIRIYGRAGFTGRLEVSGFRWEMWVGPRNAAGTLYIGRPALGA